MAAGPPGRGCLLWVGPRDVRPVAVTVLAALAQEVQVRIAVERSGGFAGLVRRAEVDTSGRADAPDWQRLVEACDWSQVQEHVPPPLAADRFVYRLEVGDQTVEVGESGLRGPLKDLADKVLDDGRAA